jgi:hypothetical protein
LPFAERRSRRGSRPRGALTVRLVAGAAAWAGLAVTLLVSGSWATAATPSPPAPTAVVEPIAGRAGPGLRIAGPTGDLSVAWHPTGTLEVRGPVRWRVDRDRLVAATGGLVEKAVVAGRLLRVTLAPGVVALPLPPADRSWADDRRWLLLDRRAGEASSAPAVIAAATIAEPSAAIVPLPEPAAGPGEAVAPGTDREHGTVEAIRTAAGAELRLAWPPDSAATVLQRGGQVWIALSRDPATLDMDRATLASALAGLVVGLREVPADRGRVLQLRLERAVGLAVRREGDVWVIALTSEPGPPPQPAPLPASAAGITLAGAETVIAAADEATGDQLFFAPLREAPLGLPRAVRLPDADLLATAQGLAWRARSDRAVAPVADPAGQILLPVALGPATADRLAAGRLATADPAGEEAAARDGIARGDAENLAAATGGAMTVPRDEHREASRAEDAASVVNDAERTPSRVAALGVSSRPGSLAAEQPRSAQTRLDTRTEAVLSARGLGLAALDAASLAELRRIGQRLAALAAAPREPSARTRARVAWARTLIGADRSAEALGLLELEPTDADAAALAAVAALLADRPVPGVATLLDRARDADPEIGLWRLLLPRDDDALAIPWPAFDGLLSVLERYPPALRFEVGRRLAERAIDDGQGELALKLRDMLDRAPLSPRQQAVIAWLAGTVLGREGDLAAAREQLAVAARLGAPAVRAAAGAELVRAEREAGAISTAVAVQRLAAERPYWRGLPNEGPLLVRLGDEAERADRPIDALLAWREALGKGLAAGPSRRLSERLQATFVASLERLTAAARADPAIALDAVALLDTFPELVPPGQPGTALRSAVARSLVPAGLPKLALRLAEPLGREEPMVGALERASWHLDAAEPERAMAVLDGAAAATPSGDQARMAVLRASARLMLADPTGALGELGDFPATDPAAETLRREALWRLDDRGGFMAAVETAAGLPTSDLDRLRLATIAFAGDDQERARDLLTVPADAPADPALAALRIALTTPVPRATSLRELLPTSDAAQRQARALTATGAEVGASIPTDARSPERG